MATDDPTSTDAEWNKIQQNVFTRWANLRLHGVYELINNLETDLGDGLRLIKLLEVLSGKKLPRYHHRCPFNPEKMENISIALKFIEDENIKLFNIDASDIFRGNLKIILGLMWTLVLRYSIGAATSRDTPELDHLQANNGNGSSSEDTPRNWLLRWVQRKLAAVTEASVTVTNFTTDWNDGRAICALVEAFLEGAWFDWKKWKPGNEVNFTRKVMNLAEGSLNIPQIITPEELCNPNKDEMSVMTYVVQFCDCEPMQGGPVFEILP